MRPRPTKARAVLALALLRAARALLDVQPVNGDFDTCTYCGATGCEDGSAVHKAECPSLTGVFPIALRDIWPDGPTRCGHCDTTLWPGDHYVLLPLEDGEHCDVFEVVCVGCKAQVELLTA